jgi:hypothetical protein
MATKLDTSYFISSQPVQGYGFMKRHECMNDLHFTDTINFRNFEAVLYNGFTGSMRGFQNNVFFDT